MCNRRIFPLALVSGLFALSIFLGSSRSGCAQTGSGGTGFLVTGPDGNGVAVTPQGYSALGIDPDSNAPVLNLTGHENADIPYPVVDTSQSFTVAAWVKVNAVKGYQTFVSVDGSQISGFYLQLRGDTHSFAFNMMPGDAPPNGMEAQSTLTVNPGVWYNLIGVYDAAAHTLSLYVDGRLQQTVPFTSGWKAPGHTEIGRAKYNGTLVDYVDGAIRGVELTSGVNVDSRKLAQIAHATNADVEELSLDLTKSGPEISPTLYGLMIEDINHSIDGGLYAELIRNRAFKDDPTRPVHWSMVESPGAVGSIALDNGQPILNTALTVALRLDTGKADIGDRVGVANEGYWGIPVRPHTRYRVEFYAKGTANFTGPVTVDIETKDGSKVWASATVPSITGIWMKYSAAMTTGDAPISQGNRFVLSVPGTKTGSQGTIWLSQVSLFPPTWNGRPNGTRKDIMQLLEEMKPAFLRLPGGNYLEGNTVAERFEWKDTIHDIAKRPGHQDPWGYRSSDGFGLLEYLEWCEDLHMQPILAIYAGYSLGGEHVDAGPALQPYVQDALDEIQYVSGSTTTPFGAMRAADGHPAPFNFTYLEVGNEDMYDRSGSYDSRFAQFYDAVRASYPTLKIIATSRVKSRIPDVLDDHYYPRPEQFEADTHHYDDYDRAGPKIFVGEYASQEGKPTPDMNAALGDAAWMTGLERNSDVVLIESYAPLLVNLGPGALQWGTNLIGFDGLNSYGSPSYYVQKLFSLYHGDHIVPGQLTGGSGGIFYVASRWVSGDLTIKFVNAQAVEQPITILINSNGHVGTTGKAITLSAAHRTDTNTIDHPTYIAPIETKLKGIKSLFTYTLKPLSVTVLQLKVH